MKTMRFLAAAAATLAAGILSAQPQTSHANVRNVQTKVIKGHLDLGGSNGRGGSIEVNSRYIERDGRPYIPVIGEFHYSRYNSAQWEQEIQKMKAGGISVIATYVFWSLHEPVEGHFDWSGDKNLRGFVELCGKNDVDVIVRVGPFAHGEMRSGGFPDWLYGRPIEVRSNDSAYLAYVERLYNQIGAQLRGLFYKDGGPIVGVQIENEYQHSAAPWGFTYDNAPRDLTVAKRDVGITQIQVGVNQSGNANSAIGQAHMVELKRLAVNAGLIAPLYTATGWGYATIIEGGSIPVMSCYAYPSWQPAQHTTPFFLYKDICSNPDYAPVSYDTSLYPSLAAELGTGMMPSWSRRTFVPQESMLPMMVRTIGSGSNGLGYYMYHGGTTPSVGNYFYTEGFGLSLKSYDYQAPIGEYGRPEQSYRSLKLINYFLNSYGDLLAPMATVLPDTLPSDEKDVETLRWAVRSNGEGGFVFMHNFQDHVRVPDLEGRRITVSTGRGEVSFPVSGSFNLPAGASAIFPFMLEIGGVPFKSATLQPFCRFTNGATEYNVLCSVNGIPSEILLQGGHKVRGRGIKTSSRGGDTLISIAEGVTTELTIDGRHFLVLDPQSALDAYLTDGHLFITEGIVCEDGGSPCLMTTREQSSLTIYPAVKSVEYGNAALAPVKSADKTISRFELSLPRITPAISMVHNDPQHYTLDASALDWNGINEIWLRFDYRGDRAMCMMGGQLQTDDLYNSRIWTVGLKKYSDQLKSEKMYFYFLPMQKGAAYLEYLNEVPDFGKDRQYLSIAEPEIEVERRLHISLK